MSELRGKGEPVYPTTLDVINYGGNEYQVIASAQSGTDFGRDLFVLKDITTGEVIRVKGAVFTPFKVTRNPGIGDVHLRDEGVRITGSIAGGEIE